MTPDPLLSKALEGFALARRADGYSRHTIDQYRWALEKYLQYIGDKPLSQYTLEDARSYLAHMQDSSLSTASVFHIWKALRALYKWASPEFEVPNVMLKISKPRYETKEIIALTNEDIEKALKTATVLDNNGGQQAPRMALRNRLLILFMLDTGVRVGELSRLNVQDINMDTCEVRINPYQTSIKSRPRTVYIGKRVQKELWKYLLDRDVLPNEPLFVTVEEKRMTPNAVKHVFKRIAARSGVHIHPHLLRHSFATQYLFNGGDAVSLQRLLGHTTLAMVTRYVNLSNQAMETIHRRSSPVDNWRL